MRCQYSPDNGQTWQPVGVVRTTPGGPDYGQTDRSTSGEVALTGAGATVQLGTVPDGKTWLISDLFFQLDASAAEVSVQVDGVPMWIGVVGTQAVKDDRRWPLVLPGGSAVTIAYGAPGAGTPNAFFNLGMFEQ